jgi:hypothetical protein
MFWAPSRGRDAVFTIVSVLGTLGRESVMFLTPAIFTPKQWKRAILPIVLTVAAFVLPRILLRTPGQGFVHFYAQYDPLRRFASFKFWKGVAISWSYLWLVLPVGMICTPRQWRSVIFRSAGWVALGTCFALAMADDTERYVSYLTPFVFLATSFLVDVASSRLLEAVLIVLAPVHLLVMLATVPFPVQPHGLFTSSLRLELFLASSIAMAVSLIGPMTTIRSNLVLRR